MFVTDNHEIKNKISFFYKLVEKKSKSTFFASIHETNFKKQGMLRLTLVNETDYDLIQEDDTFNFLDLNEFTSGKSLTIKVVYTNVSKDEIKVKHTYNQG